MNRYFKKYNTPRHIEVIEITEDSWLSLTKKLNKVGDPLFEIYKTSHNDGDYDDSAWWKNSINECSQQDFDDIKFEFLNWIDQNLQS